MARNLKIISLALLLVALAVSALAATGAFATEEEGEGTAGVLSATVYPATLDGTDISGKTNAFTLFGMKIECPDSSFSGEITDETSEFTLTPTYSTDCVEVEAKRKATITMNGCDYTITLRKTTDKDPPGYKENYFFTTYIVCPEKKEIAIHIYTGANENTQHCEITIGSQERKDKGKAQNEQNGKTSDLKLEHEVQSIAATKDGACGKGTTSVGKYDIAITLQGTTKEGGVNSLQINHD